MNDLADERDEDELEDDEVEEVLLEDERDIDRAFREMEVAKRRRPPKAGEPAWRKLEQRREREEMAALISDLEDYDLDGVQVDLDTALDFGEADPQQSAA
jgi:hypothetical protein